LMMGNDEMLGIFASVGGNGWIVSLGGCPVSRVCPSAVSFTFSFGVDSADVHDSLLSLSRS